MVMNMLIYFLMDLALGLLISHFYCFDLAEKNGGASTEIQNQQPPSSSKPLKAKTTKAERRALQEAQRAAKVSAKGLISNSIILNVPGAIL